MVERGHVVSQLIDTVDTVDPLLLLLLMQFIGRRIRGAANAPSQLLHGNSYPRTGTFSVIS